VSEKNIRGKKKEPANKGDDVKKKLKKLYNKILHKLY